ncbi:glutathione peroxidase [Nonomuraea gerenzanensis]|uniref:Glutathione peroxidase n=1 Tax=Nonomuraea gerenzanensis TaxID=93944 RepID=A0A1M4EK77_9ACTN|nr:glutathione peroxidase [Nonomuraea gerenzanensis]UBU10543.1 glutathione peroxidase [Nonomuraea gerenzanensis]SBO98953.1 Glutathione peroxidase family protein [Nonomuraea gerenzanensis]
MSLSDIPLRTLTNDPTTLADLTAGKPALIVNVASRCGLTPQYTGLVKLQQEYGPRGLTVIGMPCNQFGGQEPGTAAEIQHFCSTTYGVDFPLLAKAEVNGPGRHPLYEELTRTPDEQGEAGDVQWNFEKFLVDGEGRVVARFRPRTAPEDPEIISAIERLL